MIESDAVAVVLALWAAVPYGRVAPVSPTNGMHGSGTKQTSNRQGIADAKNDDDAVVVSTVSAAPTTHYKW